MLLQRTAFTPYMNGSRLEKLEMNDLKLFAVMVEEQNANDIGCFQAELSFRLYNQMGAFKTALPDKIRQHSYPTRLA